MARIEFDIAVEKFAAQVDPDHADRFLFLNRYTIGGSLNYMFGLSGCVTTFFYRNIIYYGDLACLSRETLHAEFKMTSRKTLKIDRMLRSNGFSLDADVKFWRDLRRTYANTVNFKDTPQLG